VTRAVLSEIFMLSSLAIRSAVTLRARSRRGTENRGTN
jgi:hypothetical protein